jgi:hypothetical protein
LALVVQELLPQLPLVHKVQIQFLQLLLQLAVAVVVVA